MKKMLITGGTVFVSRFAAEYFSQKYDVFVLNRNTRPQCDGVTLIEVDRHALGEVLKGKHFDVVIDTAYDAVDVKDLLDGLDSFEDYILISSSAVYPETEKQPFTEGTPVGPNRIWGTYGTNKIGAEMALRSRVPNGYILRPPYLYGPGNNVYREAFVFDCAMENRIFYLPQDGEMKLQFFHVRDLFRLVDLILEKHPAQRVFNVGNETSISVKEWVELCYKVVGKNLKWISVGAEVEQRAYFPFYRYEYALDISRQHALMQELTPMEDGLREAFAWYLENKANVVRKPLLDYIDQELKEQV